MLTEETRITLSLLRSEWCDIWDAMDEHKANRDFIEKQCNGHQDSDEVVLQPRAATALLFLASLPKSPLRSKVLSAVQAKLKDA